VLSSVQPETHRLLTWASPPIRRYGCRVQSFRPAHTTCADLSESRRDKGKRSLPAGYVGGSYLRALQEEACSIISDEPTYMRWGRFIYLTKKLCPPGSAISPLATSIGVEFTMAPKRQGCWRWIAQGPLGHGLGSSAVGPMPRGHAALLVMAPVEGIGPGS